MTNHSLNTQEHPVSGGILWSQFPKWSTWNIMCVSLATAYTCGPVPALTLATGTILSSHVCPHLCSGILWCMSSHGKPGSRSCKRDLERKREDTYLWISLINWESHTHRFFSQLFVVSAFSAFQFPLLFFLKQLRFHLSFSGTVTQMQSKRSPKNQFSIGIPTLTCSFPRRLTNF